MKLVSIYRYNHKTYIISITLSDTFHEDVNLGHHSWVTEANVARLQEYSLRITNLERPEKKIDKLKEVTQQKHKKRTNLISK